MSRTFLTKVVCDNCGKEIGTFSYSVDQQLKEKGSTVNKAGDFCNEACYKEFLIKNKTR